MTALLAAAAVHPTLSLLEYAGGDAVEELIAAGVLVEERDAIRFAHPLLAVTAYATADAGERAAAHSRLAAQQQILRSADTTAGCSRGSER